MKRGLNRLRLIILLLWLGVTIWLCLPPVQAWDDARQTQAKAEAELPQKMIDISQAFDFMNAAPEPIPGSRNFAGAVEERQIRLKRAESFINDNERVRAKIRVSEKAQQIALDYLFWLLLNLVVIIASLMALLSIIPRIITGLRPISPADPPAFR